MAIIRSIVSVSFVACLFLALPGFASAQDVYEVQTSSDDYVVVGVHPGATMDEVVVLARRLSGNAELTSEDVLANVPHARRYVCRHNGRQLYFGTDPAYGGLCPEGARRSDGIIAGVRYRIPRAHGDVLPPVVRSRVRPTAPVATTDATSAARIAELEGRLATLQENYDEAMEEISLSADAFRDDAEGIRELGDQLDEAEEAVEDAMMALREVMAQFDAEHQIREEAEMRLHDAEAAIGLARQEIARLSQELADARRGEVTLNSRFYDRPLWGAFALLAVFMIGLFLCLLWPIRRHLLKPHLAYRERLEGERDNLKTNLEGEQMAYNVAQKEHAQDAKKSGRTVRLLRYWLARAGHEHVRLLDEDARKEQALGSTLRKLEELKGYQDRKRRIAVNQALLVHLRDQEEPFNNLQSLVDETMEEQEAARLAGDADGILNCERALQIYQEQRQGLGSPDALRAEIAKIASEMAEDMDAQCGVSFDPTTSDERFAQLEVARRSEKRKHETAKATLVSITAEIVKADAARAEEFVATKRELEAEVARLTAQLAYFNGPFPSAQPEPIVGDEVPSDPPPGAFGGNGARTSELPRPRKVTEDFARAPAAPRVPSATGDRWSSPPPPAGAPASPTLQATPALHEYVARLLDEAERRPDVPVILSCDKHEARDLALLLHNASALCPQLMEPVRLSELPAFLVQIEPSVLTKRHSRAPSMPPAPLSQP